MTYTIFNDKLSVSVNTLGAEVVSVKKDGNELLWQNQTGSWTGHAPILFPACGFCDCVVDGVKYPLTKHGFARGSQFCFVEQTNDSVTFALQFSDQTLKTYPYRFRLVVTYLLDDAKLIVKWTVQNLDDKQIYFFFGGHEAHYLPKTIGNYQLVFDKDETFDSLVDTDGLLNGEITHYGKGKILNVPASRLDGKESVILGNLNSRKVTLQDVDGNVVFTEQFDGFANMLLWSPDGQRALCVEPWQNLPDAIGKQVDFTQKPNVSVAPVGGQTTFCRTIEYK